MQAVLITAYKDAKQLDELLKTLYGKFKVYLHIDAKSEELQELEIKNRYPQVKIVKKFRINWGGVNHLKAILELLAMAAEDAEIKYIHVISGQDFPVRNIKDFYQQFENSDKIYMSCIGQEGFPDVINERLYYPVLNSNWDSRKRSIRIINALTKAVQKGLRIERRTIGNFSYICKGMVWVSLPKEAARYILDYLQRNPQLMRDLQHTLIPEEFFFQTLLVNSEYNEKIVKHNLRYTDWSSRYNSIPAYLDETDFDKIKKSEDFFARKIDSSISQGLMSMLISSMGD